MMDHIKPAFRSFPGLLTVLISVGLFGAILVVDGLAQEVVPPGAPSWRQAIVPQAQTAVFTHEGADNSIRPWVILASRGMGHGSYQGESVTPAFNRMVQSEKFVPVLVLLGLAALILLAYRLWCYKPLVPVMVVSRREINGMVRCLGVVQSQEPQTVRAQRTGTIEKLYVAQGDKVTKRQILAELTPSTANHENTATSAEIVRLVASADGVIAACNLAIGDVVYPGTPLFQMLEADQIRVVATVSNIRGAQLCEGQKAIIKMASGRESEGEVMRLDRELDPDSRKMEVQVKFQDLPDLGVIGEEAATFIATGRQTAPAVSITAVACRNEQHGVLVVDDGLVYFRPISLGVQNGKWVAALEGVKEGELVIITPEASKPGKGVRAEVMPAAFMEGRWI
jgi:multidrug efflux pump subunit AcrA (membrane-fusion protein)